MSAIDTAPKDGSFILVWRADWRDPSWCVANWQEEPAIEGGGFWWVLGREEEFDVLSPTHWAPLPADPITP